MAYHLYQTEGIILGGTNFGEANRLIHVMTHEFGFVSAAAQSVREDRSKLRYSLQDFSRSDICLVRGKNGWRIVNAECLTCHRGILLSSAKRVLVARLFLFARRLLQGEEKSSELFDVFADVLTFLDVRILSPEELFNVEIIFDLKILSLLGYIGDPTMKRIVENRLSDKMMRDMFPHKNSVLRAIREGIHHSQL